VICVYLCVLREEVRGLVCAGTKEGTDWGEVESWEAQKKGMCLGSEDRGLYPYTSRSVPASVSVAVTCFVARCCQLLTLNTRKQFVTSVKSVTATLEGGGGLTASLECICEYCCHHLQVEGGGMKDVADMGHRTRIWS
jgi:hypothetical protein